MTELKVRYQLALLHWNLCCFLACWSQELQYTVTLGGDLGFRTILSPLGPHLLSSKMCWVDQALFTSGWPAPSVLGSSGPCVCLSALTKFSLWDAALLRQGYKPNQQRDSRASYWSSVSHVNGGSSQMVWDKEANYVDCMDAKPADGYDSILRGRGDGDDGGPWCHDNIH